VGCDLLSADFVEAFGFGEDLFVISLIACF